MGEEMIEEIKQTLEYAKMSIESFNAEVLLTPNLIDGMLNVIGEAEKWKGAYNQNVNTSLVMAKTMESATNKIFELRETIEELQKALEFYADKTLYGNYIVCEPETRIEVDSGEIARKALRVGEQK